MSGSITNHLARLFTSAFILVSLLPQASYAQQIPMSPKEKAGLAEKKAQEKETDKAYKSSLKNIPNANKNVDPWGGLRAPGGH
jgi:hypothetical protein